MGTRIDALTILDHSNSRVVIGGYHEFEPLLSLDRFPCFFNFQLVKKTINAAFYDYHLDPASSL